MTSVVQQRASQGWRATSYSPTLTLNDLVSSPAWWEAKKYLAYIESIFIINHFAKIAPTLLGGS